MEDILAILAAGKSSRFGGYPKAFCCINGITNVENTIALAQPYFDKIYVIVNQEIHASGIDKNIDANVKSIVTGQGDADSILKALRLIKKEDKDVQKVTICWGDAVFLDETPFREMKAYVVNCDLQAPAIVGCCIDQNPYAWFDTNGLQIRGSHFQKEDGMCEVGLHDQSIFIVYMELMISYLERYKKHLGLDQYDQDSYDVSRGEMRFLDAFTYFYGQPDMHSGEYRRITEGKVKSFNTPDELNKIMDELQKVKGIS